MDIQRTKNVAALVLLYGIGCVVYFQGIDGQYYADDFKFVFEQPSTNFFYFFGHANPNLSFYRPIDGMVLAIVQYLFRLNTIPVHLLIITLHIFLCWFIFLAARRLGFPVIEAGIASVYMLCSQANALAVLSNDTLSQVGGTLFSLLSIWYFYTFCFLIDKEKVNELRERHYGKYIASVIFFSIALLFKETSLSSLMCIITLGMVKQIPIKVWRLKYLTPFLLIAVFYLIVRFNVVNVIPAERYSIILGLNVIRNFVYLGFSSFVPLSSVTVYQSFIEKNFLVAGLSIFSALLVLISVSFGLKRIGCPRATFIVLILFSVISLIPALLLQHVSELYIYNSMPLISLLIGKGLGTVFVRFGNTKIKKNLMTAFMVILFFSHVYAVAGKAALMEENGQRAWKLISGVKPFIADVPKEGTLVLINPKSQDTEYSVFLMSGFNTLKYGTNIFKVISDRNDFNTWVIDSADVGKYEIPATSVKLTIRDGEIYKLDELIRE